MPGTQDDLTFATTQQGMSDEEFLQLWHEAVVANDEQRIALFESAATRRWGLALGTTASPFDFRTRRAIGFQQSGKSGTLPLAAGRSVIAVLVLTPSLGMRCIRWPTAGNGLSQ